jgi:hypothetical protein
MIARPRFWAGAAEDEGDRPVATFVFLATLVFFVVLLLTVDFAVAFFFSFFL